MKSHLKFIDSLICLRCGCQNPTHHHLLRVRPEYLPKKVGEEDFLIPKIKSKGMGTKSDDRFTLPLCPKCHHMLHICGNERCFLRCIGVSDPEEVALYLWKNTGNLEKCLKELTEIRILGGGF